LIDLGDAEVFEDLIRLSGPVATVDLDPFDAFLVGYALEHVLTYDPPGEELRGRLEAIRQRVEAKFDPRVRQLIERGWRRRRLRVL
jgi:hypothetical protein